MSVLVRSIRWSSFLDTVSPPLESNNFGRLHHAVTTSRPTNINVVPIDYACRPRLRIRLTLRGLTLRRKPWTYGESVSHTLCRYSCQHSHFRYFQLPYRVNLHRLTERSATRPALLQDSKASVDDLIPATFSAQDGLIRSVSCYAFFKGWLLLSQPPDCHGYPTSFPT